ncbi:hypothetical protein [Paenibacillus illinoisensis]|uniref:hypothetical protein n=1 Tax=Paenibacillus illinoisensis TaxID=59845 RepID=UPI00203C7E16|nr:hypothetical protein [Paenibacillus illinoisensis]MCM3203187.1 hypothetical protein [Paenibacillus illinoisensis]
MLYAILIISILTMYYEFRQLKEKHRVREMVVSLTLFTVGTTLIILELVHVELSSPLTGIRWFFQPVSQYIARILS